ncbi:ADYC domain-containing protein [Haliangium sp.]|uniref:ADYC domain-containing protein n=1 Tax=Haliangium sp. TaxID=2663208 RepID=UPI003D147C70
MKRRHGQGWSAVLCWTLLVSAVGVAQAGMNQQALFMQGMNQQGMNQQGMNQQGIDLHDVAFSTIKMPDGESLDIINLLGSSLAGWRWEGLQLVRYTGADFIGATLEGSLSDGDSDQQVTLYIVDMMTDTSENTMKCDPRDSRYRFRGCTLNYHRNDDVILYQFEYQPSDLTEPPAPLCRAGEMAMLFQGRWVPDGAWIDDPDMLTISCTDGVLAKCARNWGYKPWRTMLDKDGSPVDMRELHQACTRAARADYLSNGLSFTITGTPIDLFDNAGYNVPTTATQLEQLGYEPQTRFESQFTADQAPPRADHWAAWMAGTRYDELPTWEAMYGYDPITWSEYNIKLGFSADTPPEDTLERMSLVYPERVELAVHNPVWTATGQAVATGITSSSMNHFSPSCVTGTQMAPDRAYRWTAPRAGIYSFTTLGSDFDTVLYVYKGGREVRCNDNVSSRIVQSAVSINLAEGESVVVFVDGYGRDAGNYTLNIDGP